MTDAPGQASRQWSGRTFGLDITNLDFKKSKMPTALQSKSNVIKECSLAVQRQLQNSPGYVFGPFCPVRVDKKDMDPEAILETRACDWETLTASFHPRYHNQGILIFHVSFCHVEGCIFCSIFVNTYLALALRTILCFIKLF